MMTISSSTNKSSSLTLKRKLEQSNDSTASTDSSTTLILRKKLCLKKLTQLIDIKDNFIETITEHYYLKLNKTYLDYPEWRLKLETNEQKEEYKNYLNDKLIAKNDISLLEAKINKSFSNPIADNQTPTSSSVTKFKYEYDQNAVHERAKHEASILQRIASLRREGLWSIKRLPKLCEPKRPKAHWDYLLDEMMWMTNDFQQERKWKKAVSKKISGAVQKYFKDKEIKAEMAEKEELKRMRKNAANIAREIMNFWRNVEKVVEYKLKTIDEEKRKKELDMHLNFIVDQTEKYSSRLMKGLSTTLTDNVNNNNKQTVVDDEQTEEEYEDAIENINEEEEDEEYDEENDSDDEIDNESTIESDEDINNYDVNEEIRQLQMDSELPIEDLVTKQYFDESHSIEMNKEEEDDDSYTEDSNETTDVEDTIEEEENYQQNNEKYNVVDELKQLEEDSKIPIDQLKNSFKDSIDSFIHMNDEEEGKMRTSDDVVKSTTGGDQDDKELNSIAAQAQMLQPTGYTLETTKVKTKIPFLLKYSLREYQHVGLDWLVTMYENKLNGILADEMGLGKTIQTIALLAHLAVEKGNWGPHLIVVPTSVMLNWELEIKKWCPAFKILTYYGTPKERKLKRQGWTKFNAFHICITSYKLVTQDHGAFRRKKWKYFILDEAQNIKNFKSQRWQSLLNFQSQRRLLLTGTPLQNNLMELWSLMHFLMPHVFASHREFQQWFSNPLKFMIEGNQEYNEQLVKRLHKVLRPFLLRRLKVDVEKQMPKKYDHIIQCKLSKRQRLLYDEFMSNTKTKQTLNEGNYMSVINVLMQLRKVCNHPDLFDPRPIVSPFVCEPISFHTSSLVFNLNVDLLNVNDYFSNIPDLELHYSAFTCHRTRKLQITKKQIEETVLTQILPEMLMNEQNELNDSKTLFYLDKKLIISSSELNRRKKLFEIKCLNDKRAARVKQNIQFISRINRQRCILKPIYGQDLQDYVNKLCEPVKLKSFVDDYNWSSGYANCREIIIRGDEERNYWKHTEALKQLIHLTANDYYQELKDLILRFVIYIPPVKCFNTIRLHCSHPNVSLKRREQILIEELNQEIHQHLRLDDKCDYMFKIGTLLNTQFPEKRLIQYDCGKLQSLDILLHRLYVGQHRVLLFTQMTRMLDVLENFLNYHGYKYLRLDGSTTIENRQVLMERFNNDKRIFCFILSTRSGGVGVNLTGADTVIFYDSDWNPTMDAQAQDRCHRIGQTRDVNIYRLICEKTIEENILKKANQKRLLSEVTIEGGCFTTAVLKKHNIKELFDQPTGLNENELDLGLMRGGKGVGGINQQYDNDDNPIIDKVNEVVMFSENIIQEAVSSVNNLQLSNTISQTQFEDALAMVEDETDVLAAKELKAEVVADNAEFDENVSWDEEMSKRKQTDCQDRFESELKSIENELKPIERYAFKFLEEFGNIAQSFKEESNVIEIEKAKREWELQRLKALKEEEEREAELEDEEMMYTYPKTEIFINEEAEHMPLWCPLTPPINENDVFIDNDDFISSLYETTTIPESQLPPIHYVKKGEKRFKSDSISSNSSPIKNNKGPIPSLKTIKTDNILIPKPLFDKPNTALIKLRRDIKMQKLKNWPNYFKFDIIKSTLPIEIPKSDFLKEDSIPMWLPNDDYVLLSTLQIVLELPLSLQAIAPAHQINWDLVSDLVSSGYSKIYRSANECKKRFENIILKREETCLGEFQNKKQHTTSTNIKTKGTLTKAPLNKPLNICKTKVLRTNQLYMQDNYKMLIDLHKSRFTKISELAANKSGNYVLMVPIANRYGQTASQAFQAAHTQQYHQIEHSFLNLINPNVLHTNTTHLVQKAMEAAQMACKQSNNANFFNDQILFRSPKQYAEMRVEKDKKLKLIAQQQAQQQQQQQQQAQTINNLPNTQINITSTSQTNTKQVSQQQQQQQQAQVVPQKPTITTQLSNSGQSNKNISITSTQQQQSQSPSTTQSNITTTSSSSSPSSPTVSTLLNNSNLICKTTPNIRNVNSNSPSTIIKSSSQNQQYYQVQQQQQQRITLDINNQQTTPNSPVANNIQKSSQQPVRLFTSSKNQPITELRKHSNSSTSSSASSTSSSSIVQQQTSTTLLKQATSGTQIVQQQKKDNIKQQQQQQQLPQIATIATGSSTTKIEQTKPTTMIISSNPSYTSTSNNSTPTTLITTTAANKSPAVLVKQNSSIKTATIASPPLTLSTSSTGATLITNSQGNFQQISRQQMQQSTPPPSQQTTNNIILTSSSSTSTSQQVPNSPAGSNSPATFAALIKPVNTVTLSLPQQKLPQANIITTNPQSHQYRQIQFTNTTTNQPTIVSASQVTLSGGQNPTQQPIRKVQFINRPIQVVQPGGSTTQKSATIYQQVYQQQPNKQQSQQGITTSQTSTVASITSGGVNSPIPISRASIITTPSSISLTNSTKTITTNPPILSIQSTNQQPQQVVTIPNNSSSLTQVLRQFTTNNSNININTVNLNSNLNTTIHQQAASSSSAAAVNMQNTATSGEQTAVNNSDKINSNDSTQPNSSSMNNSNENITFID